MRKIEICFSPDLVHLYDLTDKNVVVVDIFRATSTMVTALANGVESITPVADLESCRAMKVEGYLIAGERNGRTAEGFELGNSPLAYLEKRYNGKRVAMTTTNGTLAIEKSKIGSAAVLVGAFLNLEATAGYLINSPKDLLIHCAGWKGKFNLEDSLYAGALAERLSGSFDTDCDGVLAMRNLYQQQQGQLKEFLNRASHAKRLQNHGIEADIDFCLSLNSYGIVGVMDQGKLIALGSRTVS